MSKFDEIKNDVGTRGKSLLTTVADILETINKRTLAFATDFSGFAVEQVRLPTQANDFGDYRDRSKDAYSKFGTTLKSHGSDLIAVVREVPAQIKSALTVEAETAKTPVAKKTTAKKAPAKKAAAKSEPAAE